ncbi:CocE/NonD family hydrolase [Streptomyces sp. NPDC059816]
MQDGTELSADHWVADRTWSTGRVGLGGMSCPGGIQLLIAAR